MVSPGRVAFSVFGFDIMWYGILIGLGFVIGTLVAYKRAPGHGIESENVLDMVIWLIPAAIIGARAYYVLFSLDEYAGNFKAVFNVRNGGLAIHGGLILGVLTVLLVCRIKKIRPLAGVDLLAVMIPLGQAMGRWGNFFNEEVYGRETDLPWAQIIDGTGYHPLFLYESIWCLLMFIFLLWFDNNRRSFDGQIICLYLMLYSVERCVLEAFRDPTYNLMIGNMRQAQVISVALFVTGLVFYMIFRKRGINTTESYLNTAVDNAGAADTEAVGIEAAEAVAPNAVDTVITEAGISEAENVITEAGISEAENVITETGISEAETVITEAGISEAENVITETGISEAETVITEAGISEAENVITEAGISEAETAEAETAEAVAVTTANDEADSTDSAE